MIVLVTGGASSGKSAYAERVACSFAGERVYLAAMKPFGEEGARRIARHRALRAGKGFSTVECYDGLASALADDESNAAMADTTALLESLGNVVANELFAADGSVAPYESALDAVLAGVETAVRRFANVVIVGDEVGGDGIAYGGATQDYIRLIGTAACAIAAHADIVVECVAGQPFVVKGRDLV